MDMFVGDFFTLDSDDYYEYCLDPFAGGLYSWQHPINLAGVGERDDEFINESFLAVSAGHGFKLDVGGGN